VINLLPSDEQQAIVDTIAEFLTDKLPLSRHRRGGVIGVEPSLWREMAALGWIGLSLPEEAGGVGYGVAEETLAFREFGRQLAPMELFAAALCGRAAAHSGERELARSIAQGDRRCAVAFPIRRQATEMPSSSPLTVIDPKDAGLVLVWGENDALLFTRDDLRSVDELHPIDPTLTMSRFAVAPGAAPIIAQGNDIALRALLLASAMLAGIAEATRDMAAAYARQREQFGQPIGAFQAIKHLCADMALRAQAAGSATLLAAVKTAVGAPDSAFCISAAKLVACEAALRNAAGNIQVHGGIGFTSECDAHLFLKRPHIIDQLAGAQKQLQSQLIALRPSAPDRRAEIR
jgi:alkylation response protein AidB-like acyl-CoA dehydrogenase